MSHTDPQVNMRLPADLLQRIAADATANKRSTTAEVVARLEASAKTLRDEFAMAALTGMLSHGQGPNTAWHDHMPSAAEWAYEFADAMLDARKGGA
jgi:hypothetical protein